MIRRAVFAVLAIALVVAYLLAAWIGFATLDAPRSVYTWMRAPIQIDLSAWSRADMKSWEREMQSHNEATETARQRIADGDPKMKATRNFAQMAMYLVGSCVILLRALGAYLRGLDPHIVATVLGTIGGYIACAIVYGMWKRYTDADVPIWHAIVNACGIAVLALGAVFLRALAMRLAQIDMPEDLLLARIAYGGMVAGGLALTINAAAMIHLYHMAALPMIVTHLGLGLGILLVAIQIAFLAIAMIALFLVAVFCRALSREEVIVVRRW